MKNKNEKNPRTNGKRRGASPMDVSNIPIKDRVQRLYDKPAKKRESDRAYRSFLLWAMQDPDRRNIRGAGRGVSRSEGTVRQWKHRWSWNERVDNYPLSDIAAQGIYRKLYYPIFSLSEIIEVEGRLAAPFLPDAPIQGTVSEQVVKAIRDKPTSAREENREKKIRQQHLQLIDASLGLLARKIASGDIKCTIRDLPALMRLREEMSATMISGNNSNGMLVMETVRVRQAKAVGGDILEAMLDDAREVTTILDALVSAKQVKNMITDIKPDSQEESEL